MKHPKHSSWACQLTTLPTCCPACPSQGVVPVLPGGAGFGAMCGGAELPVAYQELLATCHGLAQLGHELVGDPLDQRLFEATGAPGLAGIGVFRLWPAQMGPGIQGAAAQVLSVA